jgi:hypothetical protein
MRKQIALLCVVACTAILGWAFCVPGPEPCLDEVRSLYRKLNSLDALKNPENKMYYLHYSVKAVAHDSMKNKIPDTEIRMWMNRERMEVQSKEMEVYQDEKNAFVVLPTRKMILRNDPDRRANLVKRRKLNLLQDTLFALSRIVSCEKLPGTALKRLILEVNEEGQRLLKIKRLTFLVDLPAQQIKNIRLDYTHADSGGVTELASVNYKIEEMSMDYKNKNLDGNIASHFVGWNDKLLSRYDGFKLVDNRVSANKQ